MVELSHMHFKSSNIYICLIHSVDEIQTFAKCFVFLVFPSLQFAASCQQDDSEPCIIQAVYLGNGFHEINSDAYDCQVQTNNTLYRIFTA